MAQSALRTYRVGPNIAIRRSGIASTVATIAPTATKARRRPSSGAGDRSKKKSSAASAPSKTATGNDAGTITGVSIDPRSSAA